jgi:formylglycine-generating enzyme required for sulfatase activity
MTQFIRSIAVLLISACLVQAACAQAITGKGFLPDENGTNLDDPQASKTAQRQKVAPGTIIKDCPECPEMVVLPSGSFLMGSPPDPGPDPFSNEQPKPVGEPNARPQRRVQIQSFAIGRYEVTQEQWYAFVGSNPSANKGRTLPVEQVSWDDVQEFITKLNQKTGQKYRLPSEAEWEYAARGGSSTIYPFSNSDTELYVYAWFNAIAAKTNPVGLKRSNQFGLFDMLGNVLEITQDCWHDDYIGAPKDGTAWETNCTQIPSSRPLVIRLNRTNYVARGGSLKDNSTSMHSASRFGQGADERRPNIGFRLARDL